MKYNDTYLETLSCQIDSLKEAYENAKAITTDCKNTLDATRYWIGYYKSDVDELRALADDKFYQSQMEWQYGNKDSAAVLSEEGREINQRIADTRENLNESYDNLDAAKEDFQQALSNQRAIKARLDRLKTLHKGYVQKYKEENSLLYNEKPCKGCGRTFKYRTDCKHQPNYCIECKEKFKKLKNR